MQVGTQQQRGTDAAAIQELRKTVEALEREVSRVIVGQELVVRGVTIALDVVARHQGER